MKKIFISGKVSGLPREEAEKNFKAAANYIKAQHLEDPEYPLIMTPFDVCGEEDTWAECMLACLSHVADSDTVVFLSNYTDSPGAQIEYAFAKHEKKQMFVYDITSNPLVEIIWKKQ